MKKLVYYTLVVIIIINIINITNNNDIIPNESIRMRVIPNSNNTEDIYIKNKVKEYLEKDVLNMISKTNNIDDVREIINNNLNNIDNNINNVFSNNNYNMKYNINFGYNYFPTKQFKGHTYEEGYYESLVVSIGEAKGDNWWCVMFPNLCLIEKNDNHQYKSIIYKIIKDIF